MGALGTSQLDGQPCACRTELTFYSGQRDIQCLRGFFERQSAKVPLFEDPAASLVDAFEAFKRLVQLDDGLDRVIRDPGGVRAANIISRDATSLVDPLVQCSARSGTK